MKTYNDISTQSFKAQNPINDRLVNAEASKRGVVFNHIAKEGWNTSTRILMQNTQLSLEKSIQAKKEKDLAYKNMHDLSLLRLDDVVKAFYKLKPIPPAIIIPRRKSAVPVEVKPTNKERHYRGYSEDSPRRGRDLWAKLRTHSRGGTANSATSATSATPTSIYTSDGESSRSPSPQRDRIASIDDSINIEEDASRFAPTFNKQVTYAQSKVGFAYQKTIQFCKDGWQSSFCF